MSPNSPNVAISVRFIFSIFVFVYFFEAKVVFVFETCIKGGLIFAPGWFRYLSGCCRLYFLLEQKDARKTGFQRVPVQGWGQVPERFCGCAVCRFFRIALRAFS